MTFVLITSLCCVAIHVSFTWPSMIFTRIGNWMIDTFPLWLCKPVFACLPCMGGFWSLLIYTLMTNIDVTDAMFHAAFNVARPENGVIVSMFGVVGLNTLFSMFERLIESIENLESFNV